LKILRGEIPATKIYEDETTFAILDINPHNKGHALVISKEPYRNIFDAPEEILSAMIKTVKRLVPAIQKATKAEGFNVGINNERVAGQEIMHIHFHIVPRFEGDNVYKPARHTTYKEGEQEELANKIKAELKKIS